MMMNPADMQMNQPPAPGGQPQSGGPQMEQQLVELVKQIADVAAKNGIDFQAILQQALGGAEGKPPTPPPPALP